MLLIAHISIALLSVLFAAFVFVSPSMRKLYVNYGFIALTLVSGSILVIRDHVNLLSICATGLTYTAGMLVGSVFIRRNLAAQTEK